MEFLECELRASGAKVASVCSDVVMVCAAVISHGGATLGNNLGTTAPERKVE